MFDFFFDIILSLDLQLFLLPVAFAFVLGLVRLVKAFFSDVKVS